ncbi:outer membrane protein [Sphingomicrobium arenosum]|uniref:outer membrane protein n=1 Tax=Sphingomicrobium arenosum TaxID=2233861 RepID=UPI00223EC02D|nr:outer membrane beta-barrel protein [Sphingomicrobium arenosum]
MKKSIIAAAVAASFVPAAAQAQDINGARVEVRAGLDQFELGVEVSDGIDALLIEESESGLSYGGEVGYDVGLGGNLFVGPYANLDFSTAGYEEVDDGDVYSLEAGRNIGVGLRLGVALNPGTGLYAKGGYSNGRLEGEATETVMGETTTTTGSVNRGGWHAGLGGEVAMETGTYFKAEALYTRYSDEDYDLGNGLVGRAFGHRLQLLAGIGLRF